MKELFVGSETQRQREDTKRHGGNERHDRDEAKRVPVLWLLASRNMQLEKEEQFRW